MSCENTGKHGAWLPIHGKDGVAGSIPAGGSTTNQQLRPDPEPGLLYDRRAPNRRLPAICQQVTERGRMSTLREVTVLSDLRSDRLRYCALSAPVRCFLFDIGET
jgi:hypothetical protein